jgi:hypothetical protein
MVIPELPTEALSDLQAARSIGQQVFYKEGELPPSARCPNCGDLGHLWFQFSEGGPYKAPPAKGIHTSDSRGFWLVESKVYPCPVCHDASSLIAYYWKHSGLQPNERAWHLDYIKGMPGKEIALQSGSNLLAQMPRPKGLLAFFGVHGRGKTGILKSLIAQSVQTGISASYMRASDILAKIRSTYSNDSGATEEQLLTRIKNHQLLAIDEFDRIPDTGWAKSMMENILDARYSMRFSVATVLATNKNPESLGADWEYLSSRLKDGERIPVGGEDLRGKSGTQLAITSQ